MDALDKLEIYIPVEAVVKRIPLWSLPASVLRRMGLPPSDSAGSKNLTGSPEGTWICPAVVRRKGQKPASRTESSVVENMSSLLGREFQAAPGPFHMSFVSSNRVAYKVLKDITLGKKLPTHRSHTSLLPRGSAPRTHQDAVVIYQGCIYLSIRKPSRSQSRETSEPQPAAQSSTPSTSNSKGQEKEMLDDSRPTTKHTTCKVTHSEDKEDVTHKVSDVSSSKMAPRGEQAAEEAAAPGPEEEQQEVVASKDSCEYEMRDLMGEETEGISQNYDMDGNTQIHSGEMSQSSSQSCARREPLGAAAASTSLLMDYDFKELAQEEMIAQMKARLRQNEDALNNLHSS